MLFTLSLILLVGLTLSAIFNHLKIPGLIALVLTGIILGPYLLNLISPNILNISGDLREIALIVILLRVGLSLDLNDLKKVGRPAILMCFIPATIEIIATVILAPLLFDISYLEAAIMGSILAAVSPAVVVPRMLNLMERGYGKKRSIPQLVMAGASVDDIYVIVLFTSFMGIYHGKDFDGATLLTIPLSIILGLIIGVILGLILVYLFKKIHMRDTIKVLIILSVSFLLVTVEHKFKAYLPISGLLAIMALGGTILNRYELLSKRLLPKFSKLWVGAEIFLFVLVGAAVDIRVLGDAGLSAALLIVVALIFRVVGVNISLIKTDLNTKERLFCAISYLPKATVQAAIGAIPLAAGVPSGALILTIAVLGIMISAPIGALGIDLTYQRCLDKE